MARRTGQSLVKWVLTAAASLAAAVAVGYGLWAWLTPTVSVTEAVRAPVVLAFYATGTVQPVREYPVKSNTAGILTEVLVDKGDPVKKGQPVAKVVDSQLQYAYDKAAADLEEKRRRSSPDTSPVLQEFDAKIKNTADMVGISQREADRLEKLVEANAASRTDLDRSRDGLLQRQSSLASLKSQRQAMSLTLDRDVAVAGAAVKAAQYDLSQQSLAAPVTGVVLNRPTAAGTRVAINDVLLRTANVEPSNLVMRAAVDEEDVTKVRVGQVVDMSLYSYVGRTFKGVVSRIYDQAEEERRTFEVDVNFADAPDRLAAGMTGELAFILDRRDATTVIPAQAVQDGVVYVLDGGAIRASDAKIGLKSVQRAEVLGGIRPGERVVISPVGPGDVGRHVRSTYVDPKQAAGMNQEKLPESGGMGGF